MKSPSDREASVRSYYQNRNPSNLSVTEFGHNIYPICLTASALRKPYKRYTGIETWFRGGDEARKRLQYRLNATDRSSFMSQSIRFVTHDSGMTIHRDGDNRWQAGSYTPYNTGEAGHEDEVVASNLFGDPDIAESSALTQTVLAQMAELAHPNGLIVLRETITPERVRPFDSRLLGEIGLRGCLTYRAINSPLWKELESIYDGGKAQPFSSESLYIFLQKKSNVSEEKTDSLQNSSQRHSTTR